MWISEFPIIIITIVKGATIIMAFVRMPLALTVLSACNLAKIGNNTAIIGGRIIKKPLTKRSMVKMKLKSLTDRKIPANKILNDVYRNILKFDR